jgi:hypothetical protein
MKVFICGRLSELRTPTHYSDCLLSSCYIRPLPYKAFGNFPESKTYLGMWQIRNYCFHNYKISPTFLL